MNSESVVQFEQVTKAYGPVVALHDVSFQVKPGEIVAVLGTNGAGKSTLMNLGSGLRQCDRGQVQVFGKSPSAPEVRSKRRCLLQELHFPKSLRVRDIIELVFAHFQDQSHRQWIERLGLHELESRLTSQMSGGERRKLGILCSLAGDPDLVLLDEPTANVDLVGQNMIRTLLLEYFRGTQRTLLFSSHQMQEVEALADRVIVLREGKIVKDASVLELKKWMGLKKVRFTPSRPCESLTSAESLYPVIGGLEAVGSDSDLILKEIISLDPQAKNFEVMLPGLGESILKIWQQGTEP